VKAEAEARQMTEPGNDQKRAPEREGQRMQNDFGLTEAPSLLLSRLASLTDSGAWPMVLLRATSHELSDSFLENMPLPS
jgi:hypothetical protein